MSIMSDVLNELNRLMRYLLPTLVGVGGTWLFDTDHDVVNILVHRDATSGVFLLFVAGAYGVLMYCVHMMIHSILPVPLFLRIVVNKRSTGVLALLDKWICSDAFVERALARWWRRGDPGEPRAHALQHAMDIWNSAGHFLYCSCWALAVTPSALCLSMPDVVQISIGGWAAILGLCALLFVLAALSDYSTTKIDDRVYKEFGHGQGGPLPIQVTNPN